MCRLIASEDLFALMDALEEPVPDEVYHYMENVGSNNTLEVYTLYMYMYNRGIHVHVHLEVDMVVHVLSFHHCVIV